MEPPDEDAPEDKHDGWLAFAWLAGSLSTWALGVVLMNADDGFAREERAHDLGDRTDWVLYPGMFYALLVVSGIEATFTVPASLARPSWSIRGVPFLTWVCPLVYILLYLVVFRPRG